MPAAVFHMLTYITSAILSCTCVYTCVRFVHYKFEKYTTTEIQNLHYKFLDEWSKTKEQVVAN